MFNGNYLKTWQEIEKGYRLDSTEFLTHHFVRLFYLHQDLVILTVKWAWAVKNKGLKLFHKLWTPNGTQQWVTFVIIYVWHRTNNQWKSVGNIPHKPMSFHTLWVTSSEVIRLLLFMLVHCWLIQLVSCTQKQSLFTLHCHWKRGIFSPTSVNNCDLFTADKILRFSIAPHGC